MKRSEDWSRAGGVIIALLAAALAVVVLMPRLLGVAAGPEVEIITALKHTEQDALVLPVPGSPEPLKGRVHHFARITVTVAPDGEHAVAWATLDLTGKLGDTEVSTLGVERVPFVRHGTVWQPEGSPAPRLVAVVRALAARRRALEAGDLKALGALRARSAGTDGGGVDGGGAGGDEALARLVELRHRRYRAEAWYVRLERDEAVANEQWHLEGELPSQPVDEEGERQLTLIRDEEEFFFSSGLM